MAKQRNPARRTKGRQTQAVSIVRSVVTNPLLQSGFIPSRWPREPLQGMPERTTTTAALIAGRSTTPSMGPCIVDARRGFELMFSQCEHERTTRKGLSVIRHMLPWWEPWLAELSVDDWAMIRGMKVTK